MAGIYHASTRPGGRLPHAWLESAEGRIGTHQLVRPDRFCLLCDREDWRLAASHAAEAHRVAIDVVVIGEGSEYRDAGGEWARKRQVEPGGAILVRPDAHIAWRQLKRPADPVVTLERAIGEVLCLFAQ